MKEFALTQGLHNISSLPVSDDDLFTFVIGDERVTTSKYVAAFVSPKISQLLKEDPFFDEFEIEADYYDIDLFERIIRGDKVKVPKEKSLFLKTVAIALCNIELLKLANELATPSNSLENITVNNVLEEIIERNKESMDIAPLLAFAAKNISRIKRTALFDLDPNVLDLIISDNNLLIENEDWLYEMLVDYLSYHDKSAIFLLRNVAFECVSSGTMSHFIKNFSFENMSAPLWSALCGRLTHEVAPSTVFADRFFKNLMKSETGVAIDDTSVTHVIFDEKPFDGILNKLRTEAGANPHDMGMVKITASSRERAAPKKIADYDWNGWFFTNNTIDSWIQIDFKDNLVSPTHYAIKSDGNHCSHLKSWVLEGSNDEETWKVVDQRNNQDSLNGDFAIGIFKCNNSKFYKYLRIRQIGENTSGNYYLGMCNFEVYGDMKPA